MQLSIIIVNFNTPELSLACIKSIEQHTMGLDYEIILVDNAPKVNHSLAFKQSSTKLIYLYSATNIGFGRANNMGMEIAKGDYFLLINSDTLLMDNSINKCFEFMSDPASAHIGLIGCRLLHEDGSYQGSFYPFTGNSLWDYCKSNNPVLYKLFNVAEAFRETHDIKKVGDVSGAFMFLRRKVFEQVKGFDPDFFLYCEETEWCRNRIAPHFDIYYYPKAAIIHLGGKSAPKQLMYLQSQLSLALFWYKTGIGNYFGFIVYSCFNAIFYLATFPFVSQFSKERALEYTKGITSIFPYLFFEIPRYKRSFHSRTEGIVLNKAKKVFFK